MRKWATRIRKTSFGALKIIVYNGKNPDKIFPKLNCGTLTPSMIKRINHQLEQKCRIEVGPDNK